MEDAMPRYARSDQPLESSFSVTRQALSVRQFCDAFGLSEAMFYKIKKQGLGPREMKVGARTLISLEAASAWRIERENAATNKTTAAA
jgi:predicted DNA-binding transcriptional regulator AlpA